VLLFVSLAVLLQGCEKDYVYTPTSCILREPGSDEKNGEEYSDLKYYIFTCNKDEEHDTCSEDYDACVKKDTKYGLLQIATAQAQEMGKVMNHQAEVAAQPNITTQRLAAMQRYVVQTQEWVDTLKEVEDEVDGKSTPEMDEQAYQKLHAWMDKLLQDDANSLKSQDPPKKYPSMKMKARMYVFEAKKLAHSVSVAIVARTMSCKDVTDKLKSVQQQIGDIIKNHPDWKGKVIDICDGPPCGPPPTLTAQEKVYKAVLGEECADKSKSDSASSSMLEQALSSIRSVVSQDYTKMLSKPSKQLSTPSAITRMVKVGRHRKKVAVSVDGNGDDTQDVAAAIDSSDSEPAYSLRAVTLTFLQRGRGQV